MVLTGDYLLIALIGLALTLSIMALRSPNLLLRMSATLVWFTLSIMFFTNVFGTSVGNTWTEIIGMVFLVLAFFPLLVHMDTEIKREVKGVRWTEYGPRPRIKGESSYDSYARELRQRIRRSR